MQKRKIDRKNQFLEVLNQLKDISKELGMSMEDSLSKMVVNEADLSLNRLEELRAQLLICQNEKVFYIIYLLLFSVDIWGN